MNTDVLPLPDAASLPDDPTLLKELVLQLLATLRDKDGRIAKLEQHMDWLARRMFGRSREKLDPRQKELFDKLAAGIEPLLEGAIPEDAAPEAEVSQDGDPPATSPTPTQQKKKPGHGRRPKPDHLKRVQLVHDLTDAEKQALAGDGELVLIGEEITEHYEFEPSCLFVVVHVQKKYARRPVLLESGASPGEKNIVTAPKPPLPIPGGNAGPGLLAQVLVNRYLDHLPFNRQVDIMRRYGQMFSRQTLDGWALACADLLRPLYTQMKLQVLASNVIWTDDTPVRVRDAQRKLEYLGRFWTYVGDERHRLVVFDYTPDRSRDGPQEFLGDYRGYLQADAYSVYDALYAPGHIVEVACWAHARRKFFDNQATDRICALTALVYIRQLYDVERELAQRSAHEWRELPWEARAALVVEQRQARARPVLEKFQDWLQRESARLLPKHALREATDYVLGNWQAFCRYVENGELSIDNNPAERSLRGIAIGRKNWLFCGNDRGGRAAAVHFSLLASCKQHKVDPFRYLRHVLERRPLLGPEPDAEALRPLLPDSWRPE